MTAGDRTVIVGMSGGVDSAVAAALLLQQGWRVIGVTMRQWNDPSGDPRRGGCCSLAAVQDARRTCAELGIPHYSIDLSDLFRRLVVDPFVRNYAMGQTPNPCTWCNANVRFEHLASFAQSLGASHWATGHYARVHYNAETGFYELWRAVCREKDQSYMLYRLSQEQLRGCLFPLGTVASKDDTRALAAHFGLTVAQRRDSQDICFVSGGDYRQFLAEQLPRSGQEGPIVDESGRIIGHHRGIWNYTIGQRRGLPASSGGPRYVVKIEPATNTIHVGPEDMLYSTGLVADQVVWTSMSPPRGRLAVDVCIRYNAPPVAASIEEEGEVVVCHFRQPRKAVTPGQAAVFYVGDCVVGGGVIRKAMPLGDVRERA